MLMHKGKSVGIGVVAEGHTLHGHAIPQGYVKVIIDYYSTEYCYCVCQLI